MLWLLARMGGDHRTIVRAACDIAETVLVHIPDGETRPAAAIAAARAWADGPTPETEAASDAAGRAAAAAADAAEAASDAAGRAAAAAARAADAAGRAAAAAAAAAAAEAAEAAAEAWAEAAARAAEAAEARHADIVRRWFPEPPVLGGEG